MPNGYKSKANQPKTISLHSNENRNKENNNGLQPPTHKLIKQKLNPKAIPISMHKIRQ